MTSDEQARPVEDQLSWERRFAPRAGLAAFAAAAFVLGSFILQVATLRHTKNDADLLRSIHRHASSYVAGGILELVALLFVTLVLWYLYRAARHRRPQTPRIVLVLAFLAPIAVGVVAAINPFLAKHYAAEFVALPRRSQTAKEAKHLLQSGGAHTLGIASLPATLAFAFTMVVTNVNAMRAGLVSTFVGVVGVIGGLLFVIQLGPPQILLFFWLAAVGVVILDRWPGGRGPAWASGKPDKWPSAMERRAQMAQQGGTGPQPPVPSPQNDDEPEPGPASASRSSRKRKRKQGRKH